MTHFLVINRIYYHPLPLLSELLCLLLFRITLDWLGRIVFLGILICLLVCWIGLQLIWLGQLLLLVYLVLIVELHTGIGNTILLETCTVVTKGFAGVKLSWSLKTFGSFTVNIVRPIIVIANLKMFFTVKYGWNGILSVFLFSPSGLFDPVWYRNNKWNLLSSNPTTRADGGRSG